MSYDHQSIDKKWQKRWAEAKAFEASEDPAKEKYYCLIEFPYPSGAGLHIGHPRSYVALDIVARQKRMLGKNVLYPIGWDAFGLPTENYAIKTGRPPQEITKENTDTFRAQLQALGLSFDWSREINTTDPAYYKWTQWMFLEFFKAGLAYKAKTEINWCPKDKIGLANEEAAGGVCDRCGGPVEKREKEQWMIAITKYADRLLSDLDTVDYLPKIKKQQQDWIGKSEGAEIDFDDIKVFTSRPDTIFGATYVVLSPEHPLVSKYTSAEYQDDVENYVAQAKKKSEMERADDSKEKTGVFTGGLVTNPATGKKIPVWVADYVLGHYGTGAIMAVPAHDERDLAFATRFDLPVVIVVKSEPLQVMMPDAAAYTGAQTQVEVVINCFSGDGIAINSDFLNGLTTAEAKETISTWLEEKKVGQRTTKFKLRDWVFSRQRYWGEPIPLVHCEKDGWVALPVDQLPLMLPEVKAYEPTDNGESPLSTITDWVNTTCPICSGPAKRETDTMPNWAGSSWYFLRYCDPHNDQEFASMEALKHWMPIDLYNGGMEHTTLHLLYSRFWNKFLFDRGLVPTSEPYARRHSHGLIMGEDGTKMSKSVGKSVNPDGIVKEYGADVLRVYEMFMGPFEEPVPWNTNGLIGVRRFLERVLRLPEFVAETEPEEVTRVVHKTVKKISTDIDSFGFNTAVAAMMSLVNEVSSAKSITKDSLKLFVQILCPFAPHVANELYEQLGGDGLVEQSAWPQFDATLAADKEVSVAVQVNGKVRANITVPAEASEAEVIALARAEEKVAKYLTTEPKKIIYVPGRMVSFVV